MSDRSPGTDHELISIRPDWDGRVTNCLRGCAEWNAQLADPPMPLSSVPAMNQLLSGRVQSRPRASPRSGQRCEPRFEGPG